jgi:hypothetical protein
MTLYPLPAIVALAGWAFAYYWSGRVVILLSLAWLAVGMAAFLVWAWFERTWPFAPVQVREPFIDGATAPPKRRFGVLPPPGGEGDGYGR